MPTETPKRNGKQPATGTVWVIRDWNKLFENSRSRGYENLKWVPVPNEHDGDMFQDLIDQKNGMAYYAAWILIVQVASRCKPRGVLVRKTGDSHTARTLARATHGNTKTFEKAISELLRIGWLVERKIEETETPKQLNKTQTVVEPPKETAANCQPTDSVMTENIQGADTEMPHRKERKGKEPPPQKPALQKIQASGEGLGGGGDNQNFSKNNYEQPGPPDYMLEGAKALGVDGDRFCNAYRFDSEGAIRCVDLIEEAGKKVKSPMSFFEAMWRDRNRKPSRTKKRWRWDPVEENRVERIKFLERMLEDLDYRNAINDSLDRDKKRAYTVADINEELERLKGKGVPANV